MALQKFECPLCGAIKESFQKEPKCNHNQEEEGTPIPIATMVKILTAPQSKFMEASNPEKGKSRMKDQNKILMERAKEYARKNEHDDFIQEANLMDARNNGWLTKDGVKRKKIDDL